MVFVRFTVCGKFEIYLFGGGFGHHFGRLFVTRGSLFLVFEGTGRGWNFDGFLMISGRSPKSEPGEVGR